MTSMKVSRTFTRSGIMIFGSMALFGSVVLLFYTFHPRDEIRSTSTIRLNFEWPDSHQPETMESEGTSVIENWVASLDGIESFYSETHTSHGNITMKIHRGIRTSEIISKLRFLFRLRRHELPKNFSDIDFDQYDPASGSLDILITMPLRGNLIKDLETHMFSLEGITGITLPSQRNKFKAFFRHPGLRNILDSARTNEISADDFPGFPEGFQLKNRVWDHWVSGGKWLPAMLIRNTSYEFRSQVRLNGREAEIIRVSFRNLPEHKVVEYLRHWQHYKPKYIKIDASEGIRGYRLPMLLVTLGLFVFLTGIDNGTQLKERLLIVWNGVILTGTTLAIWALSSGLWEDWPLAIASLTCSLLVCHTTSYYSFNLRSNLIKLIPLAAIVASGGESKYGLLIIPWIAQILAEITFGKQDPYIPVGGRLNRTRILYAFIALAALAFYNVKTGMMDEFRRLPRTKYADTKKNESSVLVAYLFLEDGASSFTGSFIAELEKNILAIIKTHGQLRVDILSEKEIRIIVDSYPANLEAVRIYMSGKSIMASGISWYITHGEYSFSNRTTPLMPTFRWVITGYQLDSLKGYGARISEMLRSTPRVTQLQTKLGGWFPETGIRQYGEHRKRGYSGHIFNGKIFKWKDELADVRISTFPVSRWRLFQEHNYESGKLRRGHTMITSGRPENNDLIVKKNRNFIWEIGHEYKGTRKMAEDFMQETAVKIDAMLPPGFSRMKDSGAHVAENSNDIHKIILLMVILVAWPLIVRNSLVESMIIITCFAAFLYCCIVIFNILETLPEDWFDYVLLGTVIWILIPPAMYQIKTMALLPWMLLIFSESEAFRGALLMISFAYLLTFLVSKWFAAEVSLLRIWNGLRFYRKS